MLNVSQVERVTLKYHQQVCKALRMSRNITNVNISSKKHTEVLCTPKCSNTYRLLGISTSLIHTGRTLQAQTQKSYFTIPAEQW